MQSDCFVDADQIRVAAQHLKFAYAQKRSDVGTDLGTILGAYNAPKGHKLEGTIRGGLRGRATEMGAGLGGGIGMLLPLLALFAAGKYAPRQFSAIEKRLGTPLTAGIAGGATTASTLGGAVMGGRKAYDWTDKLWPPEWKAKTK